jgi:hypothetical protein
MRPSPPDYFATVGKVIPTVQGDLPGTAVEFLQRVRAGTGGECVRRARRRGRERQRLFDEEASSRPSLISLGGAAQGTSDRRRSTQRPRSSRRSQRAGGPARRGHLHQEKGSARSAIGEKESDCADRQRAAPAENAPIFLVDDHARFEASDDPDDSDGLPAPLHASELERVLSQGSAGPHPVDLATAARCGRAKTQSSSASDIPDLGGQINPRLPAPCRGSQTHRISLRQVARGWIGRISLPKGCSRRFRGNAVAQLTSLRIRGSQRSQHLNAGIRTPTETGN